MSSMSFLLGMTPASVSASALRMTMNCISLSSVVDTAVDRADLDDYVGPAVVGVEFDKLPGQLDRRFVAGRLEHGVSAHQFLGFGKGAVDGGRAPVLGDNPRAFVAPL